jgi:hypothetical protein
LSAKPYFVSGTGDDVKNNGLDFAHPFLTIGKAAGLTNPGDTVFIMNGTYTPKCIDCGDVVDITRSGTLKSWIVFKNYSGHSPVLKFDWWNGIYISKGASYIEINGLIIRGSSANIKLADALNQPGGCNRPTEQLAGLYNGNGIGIDGRTGGHCHHITVKKTTLYECPGAGLGAQQCDYITIDSCTIYNNCWYTASGKSSIDLFQNWNIDNASGYHNVVTHNKCFGNRLYVPWVGAPCKIMDGNGIIIDGSDLSNSGAGYASRTLIAYNIIAGNGGSGIHTNQSSHIDIVNNSAYQNAQSDDITRGEISSVKSSDITVYNNILNALPNKKNNTYSEDTNVRYDYNLHFSGTKADLVGTHIITADPFFVNPSTDITVANFNLKQGSPALASGMNVTTILSSYSWPKLAAASAPNIGAILNPGAAIKTKPTALIAPSFKLGSFIGRNQILIKTKQGYFNVKGEAIQDKLVEGTLLHKF